MNPRILRYGDYGLGCTVRRMLGVDDLCTLSGPEYGVASMVTRENDQSSLLHKRFYASFAQDLADDYALLVDDIAVQVFGDSEFYHQAVPTFRVQFPDNLAVGEFHTDADYGHQDGALNVWVPLTPAFESNTIWVESPGGYQPWQLAPGEALIFDGVRTHHGNVPNRTRCSRVSFDFRIIEASAYAVTGGVAVNMGTPLTLGHYYTEL